METTELRIEDVREPHVIARLLGGAWHSPWESNKGWVVLPHVRCAIGWGDSRYWCDIKTRRLKHRCTEATIDALAFNAWPSMKNEIHGLEIKTSRADWLRELRDPIKTEVMRRQVDKLFVLAPPGVVCPEKDKGILGVRWGHYEITLGPDPFEHLPNRHPATYEQRLRFRRKFDCPKLPGSQSDGLPRAFVAAILRADLKTKGGSK